LKDGGWLKSILKKTGYTQLQTRTSSRDAQLLMTIRLVLRLAAMAGFAAFP
jgi:hypothetical protein